jgi:hypothetical protein
MEATRIVRPRNPPVTCGNKSSFKLRQEDNTCSAAVFLLDRQSFDADLDPHPPTFCFDAYPASDPDPILDPYPFINELNHFEIKLKFLYYV